MDSTRSPLAHGIAGFLVLFSASSSFANTCIDIPLKPVQHICGIVMNQANERISNARLTLIKGGAELITIETDAGGRFDFKEVAAGEYVLRASMPGYNQVQSPIKVVKPTKKCKQALNVVLPVTSCGGGIGQNRQ
jgi:Carboxypeptidase regulatory-like domain